MASYYDARGVFLYSDDPDVLDPQTELSFVDPATGQLRPQYADLGGQVASVIGTPSGALSVGSPTTGSTGTPPFALAPNTPPEQAIQSLLSLVAPQLRGRMGGLLSGINALHGQANASPMALLGAAGPQTGQLSQQYVQALRALSQRLGPFGGGFLTQGRRQLGGQFANSLAKLFGAIPGQAQGLLGKIAEGTSIAFPVPKTSLSSGTELKPGAFGVPGPSDIKGIMEALQGIFRVFGGGVGSGGGMGGGGFGTPPYSVFES